MKASININRVNRGPIQSFVLVHQCETMDQGALRAAFISSESVYHRIWKELELRIENKVATITLNRPNASNCMDLAMANALKSVLGLCRESEHVKVISITGNGSAFCAGQDLKEVIAPDAPGLTDFLHERHHPILDMIRNMPKPVIAAVNGAAVGAGMSLALCCDLIIAKQSAFFIQSFSKIGLVPDCGSTYMLPRTVGKQRSAAMMLLADKIPAAKAEAWGMIYKAVPDEDFSAEIAAACNRLAGMPRKSMAWIKEGLGASFNNDWHGQLDLEATLLDRAGQTPDYVEGVSAFLEKRMPQFA